MRVALVAVHDTVLSQTRVRELHAQGISARTDFSTAYAAWSGKTMGLDLSGNGHNIEVIPTRIVPPSITADGTVCRLVGEVAAKLVAFPFILGLPHECRPRQKLFFSVNERSVNQHEGTGMVTVSTSGTVKVVLGDDLDPGDNPRNISLSGIEFTTGGNRNDLTWALFQGWLNDGGGK